MASSASITYGKYLANTRTRIVREFFQPATDVPSLGINGSRVALAASCWPLLKRAADDIKRSSPFDVANARFDQRSM